MENNLIKQINIANNGVYPYSKLLSETINDINKYKNGSKWANNNIK